MRGVNALLVTVPEGMGWVGNWAPGIGDPTWTGWVTTLGYFAAAYLCFRVQRRHRKAVLRGAPPAATRLSRWWLVLAVGLGLLGVNKQLDLQTLFTELGRIAAYQQGWYQQRRMVQFLFVAILGLAGLAGVAWMVRLAQGQLARLRLALIGAVFLIAFVAIRATSFHLVDKILSQELVIIRLNAIFELTGIGLCAVGAYRNLRPPGPRREPGQPPSGATSTRRNSTG